MPNRKIKVAKIVEIDINRMLVRKIKTNLLDAFLKTKSIKEEIEVSKELRNKTSRIIQKQTACTVRKLKPCLPYSSVHHNRGEEMLP